jgi:spermidine dehydrogenase
MSPRDKNLGMNRAITRRDFLNGTALAIGAATVGMHGGEAHAAANIYPPALEGMRGQHDGSFEIMHAMRDDGFLAKAGPIAETGEVYDLVVAGAGISGLAAAYLYRQQNGSDARILILDNHDDFGGHARRNEFTASNGKFLLGYGGSESLQTPSYFSPAVKKLLSDLGVDTAKFAHYFDVNWFSQRGLDEAFFFAREVFGVDKLVKKTERAADWVPQTPLNDKAKADLINLLDAPVDYFPGLDRDAKLRLMSEITYADFLLKHVKADPQIVSYLQLTTSEYLGGGIDAVTCVDAWANGNPGFGAMDLGDQAYITMSPSGRLAQTDPDDYIFHFPDGNASIARLLVRALIPDALSGSSMEDIVLARCDYGKLDLADAPVRLRLSAPVVRVKHNGDVQAAKDVEVVYSKDGALQSCKAKHCVLAMFHQTIPYIAPEVSQTQAVALKDQQKVPLLYANVQIKNWKAFARLGISGFESPGHYWDKVEIDYPVSMGGYKFADKPDEPMVLHLMKIPVSGDGTSMRDQALAGRYWVQRQTFDDMERAIRDLLNRTLGQAGFDVATDIEAITVNRWSHGYSYEYARPWDPYWPNGELPINTARKGWGRIAIANTDGAAYAYAHSAIDQAVRAVRELSGVPKGAPQFTDFPGPPRDVIGL